MCGNKRLSITIIALVLALHGFPGDALAGCGSCGAGSSSIEAHDGHHHGETTAGIVCPVTGKPADPAYSMTVGTKTYSFADADAMAAFRASPLQYLKKAHSRATTSVQGPKSCGSRTATCSSARPCCGTCGGNPSTCTASKSIGSRCSDKKAACSTSLQKKRYRCCGICGGKKARRAAARDAARTAAAAGGDAVQKSGSCASGTCSSGSCPKGR